MFESESSQWKWKKETYKEENGGGKEEEEDEEQAGHPLLWHGGVVQMGEGRTPDVKQGINERATGGQRISVKWALSAAKDDCAYITERSSFM